MPRLARLDAPGVLHHVMSRGMERRQIFLDDRVLGSSSFVEQILQEAQEQANGRYTQVDLTTVMRRISDAMGISVESLTGGG